jgi:hypothetical protein
MSYGFERVGAPIEEGSVSVNLEDAERLRAIGQNIIFSSKSSKHITDSTISASLVVANHLYIPTLSNDNSSKVYGYAEEESRDDGSWSAHVKYHWYGERDGTEIGFESDYLVDVFDDQVLFARRSLYRLRELRDISVIGNEINIKTTERRTMADTALETHHLERLEKRVGNLVRRADWSAPSIY